MGQTASTEHRNRQEAPRATHGFKPLALPALAAAVHANRKQPRRTDAKREALPILREEAILG